MANYYEILGLSYGAGIAEVKASFRHLAKLYHPDKNPEGIEHFTKILKAYEVLSDPGLKASYDYKLNYHQAQSQQQSKPNTKTWKFDERELKRRQYYNEHIKKYAKQTSEYMAEAETKKNYNEFKYILFATPLAVVLFLLVMHLATRDREEVLKNNAVKATPVTINSPVTSDLKFGDAPYGEVFGTAQYQEQNGAVLNIRNLSGKEVIVCLFTKTTFIRSFYLPDNLSMEVSQLPTQPLYIYYCSGSQFSNSKYLKEVNVQGAFTKDLSFYKSIRPSRLSSATQLILLPDGNEGFEKISEKEFFKYAKKQL